MRESRGTHEKRVTRDPAPAAFHPIVLLSRSRACRHPLEDRHSPLPRIRLDSACPTHLRPCCPRPSSPRHRLGTYRRVMREQHRAAINCYAFSTLGLPCLTTRYDVLSAGRLPGNRGVVIAERGWAAASRPAWPRAKRQRPRVFSSLSGSRVIGAFV